jgi:2-keto-4-pentenoate hydratase
MRGTHGFVAGVAAEKNAAANNEFLARAHRITPPATKRPKKKVYNLVSVVSDLAFDAKGVAAEFVRARRSAGSFTKYPGHVPADLESAYLCQDEAIRLWTDPIAGWKVGWIPEPLSEKFGANRLVGPIFTGSVQRSNGNDELEAPVFADGFAAIEAEFVVQLAKDAPANVA